MKLDLLFKGGRVDRYHTEHLIGGQNVSEHSWGVVMIVNKLFPEARKELLLAALYHDVAEATVGDIPAPTKHAMRANEETKKMIEGWEAMFHIETETAYMLTVEEKAQLKLADYLELVLFCQYQRSLGNRHLDLVEQKGKDYIQGILYNNPELQKIATPKLTWVHNLVNYQTN